jgi:antitoxin CptB
MTKENIEQLVKKLLYQSTHRGCKESDLLLGSFASSRLSTMNKKQLKVFSEILDLPDVDFYDYFTGARDLPQNHLADLISEIIAFHRRSPGRV